MTSPGTLLPAAPGQQTQLSYPDNEKQQAHPSSPPPPRLVMGSGEALSSAAAAVEAAAAKKGSDVEEYLENWQQHSHCREGRENTAYLCPPEARGRVAAGAETGAATARLPRSFCGSLFLAAGAPGGGDRLPSLAHTRRQSPASEDGLLPGTSDSGAPPQSSKHCRHGGGGGTRLWRQGRRYVGGSGSQHREKGRDVVSCSDEDAAGGDCCSTPGLLERSSGHLAASASASSHSGSYVGQTSEDMDLQSQGEEKKSSSYWRQEKAGWATLWLCPRSPLFCLQRVAIGFVYLSCCAYSMCILSVVSDQFYDPQKGPSRLHDRIHDQVLASKPFWLATPFLVDVLTVGLLVVTVIRHSLFIPYSIGLLIGQRLLFLLGTMYILRGMAIIITTVPPSKAHCDPPRIHKASDLFCFSMQQCFSLRSECTGMIISGHSITTCCSMAVWLVYGDAPAVSPLQNLRSAYVYIRAALRSCCGKFRGGAQQITGEVREVEDEESTGRRAADGRAAASAALLPVCVKTRGSAVALPFPLCEGGAAAAQAAEGPPQQRDHVHKRSRGRAEDVGRKGAAGGPVERAGEGGRKAEGEMQSREKEVILQLVEEVRWDKSTLVAAAGAAPGAASREEGKGLDVSACRASTRKGEDYDTGEEEEEEARDRPKCETNAGTCSNWSTDVDLEGRPRTTTVDAVPLRGEGGSLTHEEETHSAGADEWRRSSHKHKEEGEKTSQCSPLLQQRLSLLWERCSRCLTWQYVRQHVLTASLLRIVCLLVGCTNLLFIVLSFNHYTVDVFMAINFTLGGWSFYHFVVALLWSERLTNKCIACTAASNIPCYDCVDSSTPQTPQGWLRLEGAEDCQLEEAESAAVPGGGRGGRRPFGGITSCGAGAVVEEAYMGETLQEEGHQRGTGVPITTNSRSCEVCHRKTNFCGREEANKRREAAGEHSDSLTDASTTTATPEKHAPAKPVPGSERTAQNCCSSSNSSNSRSISCGDSPPSGKRKTSVLEDSSTIEHSRGRSRRALSHDDEWLLDLKDAAETTPSYKRRDLCSRHEKETPGSGEGACLPILLRSSEKVCEAPADCFCHEPCHSSAVVEGGADDAVFASGRTVLRKQRMPASCAEPSCRRRRVSSRTEAESCSSDGRGTHVSDSVLFALVRSSRRSLRLPLLQPAVSAIRLVEGM